MSKRKNNKYSVEYSVTIDVKTKKQKIEKKWLKTDRIKLPRPQTTRKGSTTMKNYITNKRCCPHEITTKIKPVKLYQETKDISFVRRRYHISNAS